VEELHRLVLLLTLREMLKWNARIGVGRDGMPAQPQAHFRLTNARNLIETIPTHVMEVKKGRSMDEEMVGKEREEEEKKRWKAGGKTYLPSDKQR
jgi:hypothetical protein